MVLTHPKYRPDIDGLRAIAILSVVGYHAFPSWIKGGFIGVDIFFVISGYLISSIIFSNLEHDSFSIVDFYNRRIRRIFPALIAVMIASLAFGWFFLFSFEYAQLGKHIAGGAAFVSNFLLNSENGYFDNAAETKPMLHLWSLAIEEQFYIFWPLMLAFVWKRKWSFLRVTTFIGILSFAANIYLSNSRQTAAFYWPISRFWELMIGGLLAYMALHRAEIMQKQKDIQSVTGVVLLAVGFALISKGRYFPSWWALLPTVGAFLIISAGPKALFNKYVLSNKLRIGIGLISYPLYLWHWPLLTFTRIMAGQEPPDEQKLIVVVISFIFAWLTFFLIEKNVRKRKSLTVVMMLLFGVLLIFVGSVFVKVNYGFPMRVVNKKLDYLEATELFIKSRAADKSCGDLNNLTLLAEEVCLSNSRKPQILFAGDSHAMALYSAIFAKKTPADSILISGHSCPLYPSLNYTPTYENNFDNNCTAISNKVLGVANKIKTIDTVVLTNHYPYSTESSNLSSRYYSGDVRLNRRDAFLIGEGYLIERLLKAGKRVVFVVDVPRLNYDPRECIQRFPYVNAKKCEATTMDEYNNMRRTYLADVANLELKYPQLEIFNATDIFCQNGFCKSRYGDNYLYSDEHHISIFASAKLLSIMRSDGYLNY